MNTLQAIKAMLDNADISPYKCSIMLDHKPNYIASLFKRRGNVSVSVLGSIANACGYKLCLIKDNNIIEIDELAYNKH